MALQTCRRDHREDLGPHWGNVDSMGSPSVSYFFHKVGVMMRVPPWRTHGEQSSPFSHSTPRWWFSVLPGHQQPLGTYQNCRFSGSVWTLESPTALLLIPVQVQILRTTGLEWIPPPRPLPSSPLPSPAFLLSPLGAAALHPCHSRI